MVIRLPTQNLCQLKHRIENFKTVIFGSCERNNFSNFDEKPVVLITTIFRTSNLIRYMMNQTFILYVNIQ